MSLKKYIHKGQKQELLLIALSTFRFFGLKDQKTQFGYASIYKQNSVSLFLRHAYFLFQFLSLFDCD